MKKFPTYLYYGICVCLLAMISVHELIAQPKVDPRYPIDQKDNVYTVKQYDEFIERFNFDKKTPLIKHLKHECPNCPLKRENLLLSLFDAEKVWNTTLVDSFISSVSNRGQFLKFSDRDWFVELECVFEYNGNDIKGTMYLENRHFSNNSSRWEIVGITMPNLPSMGNVKQEKPSANTGKIIPPTNHETRFASLGRVLKDKKHLANYFTRRKWNKNLVNFYHALKSGKLCLESIAKMEYHLLQIDNWIVTLQDFNRNLPNSGLLIADIQPATKEEKVKYLRERLRIL